MIICYDPGITTGWASYDSGVFKVGELASLDLAVIYNHITSQYDWNEFTIGYEDFKHRPQLIHSEMYSLQVIGTIRLWAQLHGQEEPFKYLPATAQAFWTDDKIKSLSLWTKGKKHAMDALRVLLKHLMDTDKQWFTSVVELLRKNGY